MTQFITRLSIPIFPPRANLPYHLKKKKIKVFDLRQHAHERTEAVRRRTQKVIGASEAFLCRHQNVHTGAECRTGRHRQDAIGKDKKEK